jgi:hypothetical protein
MTLTKSRSAARLSGNLRTRGFPSPDHSGFGTTRRKLILDSQLNKKLFGPGLKKAFHVLHFSPSGRDVWLVNAMSD